MVNEDSTKDIDHMAEYIAQAVDMNGQLFILIFIAAIMGLGKGGVPGFATIATALTVTTAPINITGGLEYAVALQVPILTMIDVSAAWLHSDSLDWKSVWLLLPLSFVGMVLGQAMSGFMTDSSARILVGLILLCILVFKVKDDAAVFFSFLRRTKRKNSGQHKSLNVNADDIESNSSEEKQCEEMLSNSQLPTQSINIGNFEKFKWASIVGIFGGAATMLTNSMGPILNVYLLSVRKLSPTAYIGTRAMFFCFINLGKLPMRFFSGTLGWPMLPLATGLGLVSVIGVFCAKPIMLSISERTFIRLELMVVAFAGFRLLYIGLKS